MLPRGKYPLMGRYSVLGIPRWCFLRKLWSIFIYFFHTQSSSWVSLKVCLLQTSQMVPTLPPLWRGHSFFSLRCEHVGMCSVWKGGGASQADWVPESRHLKYKWSQGELWVVSLFPRAIHLLWVVQLISNAGASWQLQKGAVMQWEGREDSLAGEVVFDL